MTSSSTVFATSAPTSVSNSSSSSGAGGSIMVNRNQAKNPVLGHIKNAPFEFQDILPDYVVGQSACVIFLMLRYHMLHPNYLRTRFAEIGRHFSLR
jgi:DNA excision repair protein ERCC-1